MEELIKRTLKIPVLDEPGPMLVPCATYMEYYVSPDLYGEGDVQEEAGSYQVDLWYKRRDQLDRESKKMVTALRREPGIFGVMLEKSCDPVTRLWRAMIKFRKLKEGE